MLERLFKLSEKGSTPRAEVVGGITTFMTMAYILVVNPAILSATGMDSGAVFTATAISACVACVMMGLIANLPVALAPGMGINAFFAYTVVLQMGYSWEMALAAVFVEGLVFIALSLLNIREVIIRSIPMVLKRAIAVGIGLFVTTTGLVSAGVVKQGAVLAELGDIYNPMVLLTFISIIIIGVLVARGVRGALLLGMVITAVVGAVMGVVTLPENFSPVALPHSIEPIMFKMDFSQIFSLDMIVVLFTFIFADLFDTAGTLFAVCSRSGMIDKEGNIPNAKRAFLADAISTTFGATMGTSTVTSYVESTAGVAAGGRTGMTAVVTGFMFFCALIFAPLFSLIPPAATAAVLVIVGLFMIASISDIDFTDYKNALPAFLTIIIIPLSYSISEGIVYGFLCYVLIRIVMGRFKDVSLMMYLLAALFMLKEILIH